MLQQKDAEIAKLRGEIVELRGAAADAKSTSQAQAESAKTLQQKDAEIAKLRGEIEKLDKSVTEARAERDDARGAANAASPSAIKPAVASAAAPAAVTAPPTEAAIPPPPDASAIKKWMKPDGSLYFGERPPEGSKFVGYTTGGGL
jgi:septal ring factor EnvC (AmiA/AmiB activator)